MLVRQGFFFLVSGPTRPGPTLVVFVSPTNEAENYLVDPRETVTHWDTGVNALLEFGEKLFAQNLAVLPLWFQGGASIVVNIYFLS